ncbi:hypothetical protein ABWH91_10775 [Phycisphaerales bacterium ac7]
MQFEQVAELLEQFDDFGTLEQGHKGRHRQVEGVGDVGEGELGVLPEAQEQVELVGVGGGTGRGSRFLRGAAGSGG